MSDPRETLFTARSNVMVDVDKLTGDRDVPRCPKCKSSALVLPMGEAGAKGPICTKCGYQGAL